MAYVLVARRHFDHTKQNEKILMKLITFFEIIVVFSFTFIVIVFFYSVSVFIEVLLALLLFKSLNWILLFGSSIINLVPEKCWIFDCSRSHDDCFFYIGFLSLHIISFCKWNFFRLCEHCKVINNDLEFFKFYNYFSHGTSSFCCYICYFFTTIKKWLEWKI